MHRKIPVLSTGGWTRLGPILFSHKGLTLARQILHGPQTHRVMDSLWFGGPEWCFSGSNHLPLGTSPNLWDPVPCCAAHMVRKPQDGLSILRLQVSPLFYSTIRFGGDLICLQIWMGMVSLSCEKNVFRKVPILVLPLVFFSFHAVLSHQQK
jgi:hypothetical protein